MKRKWLYRKALRRQETIQSTEQKKYLRTHLYMENAKRKEKTI